MSGNGRRRRGGFLTALGLVALLAVGGCGASDRGEGTSDLAGGAPAERAPAPGAPEAAPADRNQAGTGAPDLRVDQRAIIYNGSMRVQVRNVDDAARDAIALTTAAGGFVGGDQRRSDSSDAAAELTLRVPAARFTAVTDGLAELGTQLRREVGTQDVTEETVDLDARITSQRARVESARRLLARAGSITDLVSLENELARREADLASLEAKKRRLADLTALSTITVSLVGPDAKAVEDEETDGGFLVGLEAGWKVFLASMTVLLTVLGALLPWLFALGVPAGLLWWALRRRRPGRPAPVAAAPATGRPAPGVAGPATGEPSSAPGVSVPPPVPGARSAP